MAEHPNLELMRRGYAAFGSGDLDTLTELFAEDAAWHQPGANRVAGDYLGRDRVFEFFGKLVELSGATFHADTTDILVDDDRAVAIQHSTARRDGKVLDTTDAVVFELAGGKVTSVQLYPSDVDQENDFWS